MGGGVQMTAEFVINIPHQLFIRFRMIVSWVLRVVSVYPEQIAIY